MNTACNRFLALLFGAILFAGAATFAAPAGHGLKNIQNADGSRIVFGQLAGQLTPKLRWGNSCIKSVSFAVIAHSWGDCFRTQAAKSWRRSLRSPRRNRMADPWPALRWFLYHKMEMPQRRFWPITPTVFRRASILCFSASNRKWARPSLRPLSKTHQPMVLLRLQFPQPRRSLFNRRDLPMVAA